LTTIVLAGAIVIRFRSLIQLLIVAGMLAFVLVPIVRLIHQHSRMSWRLAAHVVFLASIVLLAVGFVATGLAVSQEVQSLVQTVQQILSDLPSILDSFSRTVIVLGPLRIEPARFDFPALADQVLVYLRPLLGQAGGVVTALAGGAIGTLAQIGFVIAAAYFLTLDQPILSGLWKRSVLPGYQYDWTRLLAAIDRIWAAFLRGQIILGLVIASVVTIGLSILGVRNALVLGLTAGLLEFIPTLGPLIAVTLAAMVAFFQGWNRWGLEPLMFTLIVIAFFIIVQQLENFLLVPRIQGDALNVRPAVILLASILGASLAGVLGIVLAAPLTATLILLGRYVYRKTFDLSPWDPPIDERPESRLAPPLRLRRPSGGGATPGNDDAG
jgi:predicted PurR-regulated permease PerM